MPLSESDAADAMDVKEFVLLLAPEREPEGEFALLAAKNAGLGGASG